MSALIGFKIEDQSTVQELVDALVDLGGTQISRSLGDKVTTVYIDVLGVIYVSILTGTELFKRHGTPVYTWPSLEEL